MKKHKLSWLATTVLMALITQLVAAVIISIDAKNKTKSS